MPLKNNFDPYDALIELNQRLTRLEIAHNKMAKAFEEQEKAFDVLLKSHQVLQKAQVSLSELFAQVLLDQSKKP